MKVVVNRPGRSLVAALTWGCASFSLAVTGLSLAFLPGPWTGLPDEIVSLGLLVGLTGAIVTGLLLMLKVAWGEDVLPARIEEELQ